jgi:hypothetical protein
VQHQVIVSGLRAIGVRLFKVLQGQGYSSPLIWFDRHQLGLLGHVEFTPSIFDALFAVIILQTHDEETEQKLNDDEDFDEGHHFAPAEAYKRHGAILWWKLPPAIAQKRKSSPGRVRMHCRSTSADDVGRADVQMAVEEIASKIQARYSSFLNSEWVLNLVTEAEEAGIIHRNEYLLDRARKRRESLGSS